MLVPAIQVFDMQVEFALLNEGFQELFDQFRLQIADAWDLKLRFIYKVRPSRQIDDNTRERFVEGHVRMPESRDASPLSERFMESLTQDPTHIFDRVVAVDFVITLGIDLQVHRAVPGQLSEHVIEERYARVDHVLSGAVEVQADADVGLVCLSGTGYQSWFAHSLSIASRSPGRVPARTDRSVRASRC